MIWGDVAIGVLAAFLVGVSEARRGGKGMKLHSGLLTATRLALKYRRNPCLRTSCAFYLRRWWNNDSLWAWLIVRYCVAMRWWRYGGRND